MGSDRYLAGTPCEICSVITVPQNVFAAHDLMVFG